MGLWIACVVLVAVDPPRPEVVPKDAECQIVSPTVRLYHWTLPHTGGTQRKVMVYPVVEEWPSGIWGGEVTVTPVPLCCGATRTYFRWRKTERVEPRWAGTIRAGTRYQLDFRFR